MGIKDKINSKAARASKIAHKTELQAMLREAVVKQRLADSAEKKAKVKEIKAAKILARAQQAQFDAEEARLRADLAAEVAKETQRLAEQKLIDTRQAVARLSEAEYMEKNAKKMALKRKKSALKVAAKTEKPRAGRGRKLVGAT